MNFRDIEVRELELNTRAHTLIWKHLGANATVGDFIDAGGPTMARRTWRGWGRRTTQDWHGAVGDRGLDSPAAVFRVDLPARVMRIRALLDEVNALVEETDEVAINIHVERHARLRVFVEVPEA